jgi:hypothetical protein
LKRFLEHCRGLKAKGKLKLKVGVPSLITVIEFIEILFPMLGLTTFSAYPLSRATYDSPNSTASS